MRIVFSRFKLLPCFSNNLTVKSSPIVRLQRSLSTALKNRQIPKIIYCTCWMCPRGKFGKSRPDRANCSRASQSTDWSSSRYRLVRS